MWYLSARVRLFWSGIGFFLFLGTFFAVLSKAQASGAACVQLFEPSVFRQKPDRLYDFYQQQIALLSAEEVQSLNRSFVESVKDYTPPPNTERAQTLDRVQAQKILDIVFNHPTIGFRADDIYSRPGEEMGFCFGRAMYMHLLALKIGVQKESIKKIWAVGPMQSDTPGVDWGYHVGLMVYSKEGWIVLDPNLRHVYLVKDWVQKFSEKSIDGRIRFYATEPNKFGLYSGKYSRYLLGLDLNIEQDWFKHYFVDMINQSRSEKLSDLGLTKISDSKTLSQKVMEFFGL